jgi:ADP-ribose pyrophosphatase YjhB (NUDIX family)
MTLFQPSHRLRVGAIVFNGAGAMLVVRHARRGEHYWTVPGGSAELGELLSNIAAREVLEETGYLIEVGDVLAVAELRSDRWSTSRVEIFFGGRLVDAVQPAHEPNPRESIVDVGWRLPADLHGDFRPSALLAISHNFRQGAKFLGNVIDLGEAAEG